LTHAIIFFKLTQEEKKKKMFLSLAMRTAEREERKIVQDLYHE
jgi:hypothetical protein